jgi:NADPH2 dehydrogenase
MGMKNPIPQFSHFVTELKKAHPNLAYLHIVEPRVAGSDDLDPEKYQGKSNDFIRKIWSPLPLISAGGWNAQTANPQANSNPNELIAFGRHFIANVRPLCSTNPFNIN